jgi:hypothetical protein
MLTVWFSSYNIVMHVPNYQINLFLGIYYIVYSLWWGEWASNLIDGDGWRRCRCRCTSRTPSSGSSPGNRSFAYTKNRIRDQINRINSVRVWGA